MGEDHHIPVANAEAFAGVLATLDPPAAAKVSIRVHPGLDHRGVSTEEAALNFLLGTSGRAADGSRTRVISLEG